MSHKQNPQFDGNGNLIPTSLIYKVADGPPWYPGDIIEYDTKTGVGRVALGNANSREALMLSPPMQIGMPT